MGLEDSISISKTTLKWILALALSFLGSATGFSWRAATTLENIQSRLAAVEKQQGTMSDAVNDVQRNVEFIRGGLAGPLRPATPPQPLD